MEVNMFVYRVYFSSGWYMDILAETPKLAWNRGVERTGLEVLCVKYLKRG
jgi:hypothetical protein